MPMSVFIFSPLRLSSLFFFLFIKQNSPQHLPTPIWFWAEMMKRLRMGSLPFAALILFLIPNSFGLQLCTDSSEFVSSYCVMGCFSFLLEGILCDAGVFLLLKIVSRGSGDLEGPFGLLWLQWEQLLQCCRWLCHSEAVQGHEHLKPCMWISCSVHSLRCKLCSSWIVAYLNLMLELIPYQGRQLIKLLVLLICVYWRTIARFSVIL